MEKNRRYVLVRIPVMGWIDRVVEHNNSGLFVNAVRQAIDSIQIPGCEVVDWMEPEIYPIEDMESVPKTIQIPLDEYFKLVGESRVG